MEVKQGYKNFTIGIDFQSREECVIQIFNSYEGFSFVQDLTTINPLVPLKPYDLFDPSTGLSVPLDESVIFDIFGNLRWKDITGNNYYLYCTQYPYRSLLEFLKSNKIHVDFIRISGEPISIKKELVLFSKDIFGKVSEYTIYPDNFLTPEQFQPKIVDVAVNQIFTGLSGLKVKVGDITLDGGTMQFDIFCKVL